MKVKIDKLHIDGGIGYGGITIDNLEIEYPEIEGLYQNPKSIKEYFKGYRNLIKDIPKIVKQSIEEEA